MEMVEQQAAAPTKQTFREPAPGCRKCPRLAALRRACQSNYPDWHNAPVASLGGFDAKLLIVGLAPGLRGANRTGRPFTGDAAGGYLFDMLARFQLASGSYNADGDDDIILHNTRITNAVRCLPPDNKPTSAEVNGCSAFLRREIRAMRELTTILALGRLAHDAVLRCLDKTPAHFGFAHGSTHRIAAFGREMELVSSYHCSRYNTQTGRLTDPMFSSIFNYIRKSWQENS